MDQLWRMEWNAVAAFWVSEWSALDSLKGSKQYCSEVLSKVACVHHSNQSCQNSRHVTVVYTCRARSVRFHGVTDFVQFQGMRSTKCAHSQADLQATVQSAIYQTLWHTGMSMAPPSTCFGGTRHSSVCTWTCATRSLL